MSKYKFNIKCGAKLTSVEIEADTYEDALKEVKKQALRFKGDKVNTKFDRNKLDTRDSEVAWQEFNSNDRIVSKRKEFKDKDARDKFINKLVEKDNFYTILGTRDSVNGSVDDFFNKRKGKSKTEVEKIVILAKGNPNAEKAYIKWKSEVKDALPITYSIKVSEYKGKLKIDVENEYWDSSDYAFYDGQKIYSYSENAANFVKKALNDLKINPKSLKAGQKIRQKVKDSKIFYVKYIDLKKDDGKELIKYFKDVKEAKKFVDLDGKDIIVKASNITTKDSKPFKVDKKIMHEKDANGKILYLVKSGDFYVTTNDPTGHGGGIFDVNLKNAQETFKSNLLITKLEKKYGKQEVYKKYLAGATDASVTVYTDPWSSENGGKQPRGYGFWAFAYTRRPDIKDVFFFNGNYADCKKKAIEKAKADGKTAIYVLS